MSTNLNIAGLREVAEKVIAESRWCGVLGEMRPAIAPPRKGHMYVREDQGGCIGASWDVVKVDARTILALIERVEQEQKCTKAARGFEDLSKKHLAVASQIISADAKLIEALWKTVEGTFTDANINNISTLYDDWKKDQPEGGD